MLKFLQHTIYALLFIMCCNTAIYSSEGKDYCKYSDDPIIVEEQDSRYFLNLSGSINQITFCNLILGETYKISAISESYPNCEFQFGVNTDSKFLINPNGNNSTSTASAPQRYFEFVAENKCMDFILSTIGCFNDNNNYPLMVSVANLSSDTEVTEAVDGFLPNLAINPDVGAEYLISDIFIGGDCFDVSNVNAIGGSQGLGLFVNGSTSVMMERGIIFSTGQVASAPGPCNGNGSSSNGGGTDADLAQLAGINVADVAGIEFDFIPTVDQLTFNYVFASEEYCEWVGQYNDAFGFFISGPGINGPFSNNAENIAIIPNTNTNVAINTVNHQTNTQYFNPNAGNCNGITNCPDIKYDGYTHVFQAIAQNLVPCETYHIKLIVGDANDQIFDTAVFLEANSFDAGGEFAIDAQVPGTSGNTAVEGCQDGLFIFQRISLDLDEPLTISFTVGGTATAGDDYVPFVTTITIPAGENIYLLPVEILSDLLVEGAETITIELPEDACSCLGQTAEIIIEDYLELEIETEDVNVCGVVNSTLAPIVTGGAPIYTYQWSNNQTTPTINVSPSSTTTYTVTVTDDCGETEEADITVNVEPAPTATLTGSGSFCAEDPNPSTILTITFTGPGPWDLIYTFDGQPQTPITGITENPYELIVTELGTYSLSAVENSFCPGTVAGSATIIEVDVELAIAPLNVFCYGENTGSIDLSVLSGDPNYTYQWNNAPPVEDPNNLGAGSYSVTVTDDNGCTETISTEITEPTELTADVQLNNPVLCNGGNNGAVDLTVNGGTTTYNYLWSNGSTLQDPSQLFAGTYMVTVTDNVGCTVTTSITLDEPEAMDAEVILLQDVSCNGGNDGAVDLTVTGGVQDYFYDWGGGIVDEDPNNLSFGNYTVVITDMNGCTTTASIFINQPVPILAVGVETQGVDCNNIGNGAIDLVVAGGTPGYIFSWSNGSSEEDISGLDPGEYTVTVTDNNNCTETVTVTVTEDTTPPVAQAVTQGTLSCNTTTVTIDGSGSNGGALTYEWLNANDEVEGTNPTVDVTLPGIYTLIVTNQLNGCTAETTATVDQENDIPVAVPEVSGILTCAVTTVTLDASNSTGIGTLAYQWLDSNNNVISDQISFDINTPGDFILIVSDLDNGCSAEELIAVDQNIIAPVADATTSGPLTCVQNTSTLDGSGSSGNGTITYEWFDDSNNSLGVNSTLDVNTPGDITLVVTDVDNGCTASIDITVDENTIAPNALAQVQETLTCSTVDVLVEGNGSSGNGTLEYDWQFGGNTISDNTDITVSEPGIYTLIVTDTGNGCTDETQVEVMQDIAAPSAVATTSGLITCTSTTVTLDGGGSSGNGSLNYNWLDTGGGPAGTGSSLDVNIPGTYTLIVTNVGNGCTDETSIDVEEDSDFPNPDAFADGILTCVNGTVLIDGSNSTTSGTISFNWLDSGGESVGSNPTLNVTDPDTYTLVITDLDNGCTAEVSVIVDQDIAQPTSDAGQGATLTCGANTVSLDGSGSSSGNNISYLWQNAGGVPVGATTTIDVSQTGIYTLIVTNDDNGCTDASTVEVIPDAALPTANAGAGATLTCVVTDVNLNGGGSSNGPNIEYEWFDPNNTPLGGNLIINVTNIGTYTLVVTDTDNGCSASSSVEVIENVTPPVADAGQDDYITCAEPTSTLDAGNSIGNNLSFEWTSPSGSSIGGAISISVTEIGTYTLMVTDGVNGCTNETSVEVIPDVDAPNADPGNDGLLTCAITETTLDGNNSAGGILEYEWLDGTGSPIGVNPTVEVSTIGTYTLIVTNTGNGCTDSAIVEVTEDVVNPVAEAGDNSLLTCVVFDATLDGSNSTGSPNLEFEWQNSSGAPVGNVAIIDVTETDTYTLIVTNTDNGCTASDMVEVNPDYDAPQADAGQNELLTCDVTQAILDGSASTGSSNLSFEWFNPSNTSISNDVTATVSIAGTYTLIVTNEDNGCTELATVVVDEDVDLPNADAGQNSSVSCLITDATLDGSGSDSGPNISYVWENSLNEIVGNSAIIVVDEVGVYTLIVTNNDTGCSSTASAEITSSVVLPTADAGNTDLLTCAITQVALDGSGSSSGNNIDYEWLDPSGNTISTTITATANVPGTYTIIVTDADNGCVSEAQVVVDEDVAAPTAFINTGSSTGLDCNVTSTVLDGTGSSPANSLTFLWTTVDGNIISGATTPNPEVDAEGTYLLTVINTINGCTASETIFIDQDITPPVAFINNPDELTCIVVETTLDGTGSSDNGNFSYLWSNPNGGIVSGETTLQPMINLPGVYTLVVLDGDNGCETSTNITVIENVDLPNAVATTDEGFDCVTESVTLSGNGSSVGPEFSYIWTGGNVIDDNTSLAPTIYEPGTYTLLVNNNENGCSQSADIFVDEEGNIPTAALIDVTDAPCFGYPGNLIVAEVTGGQTPYLYSVDGGQNFSSSNIFNSLEPGDYTVIIQDAIGCEHEEEVYIAPAPELTVNLGPEITIELGRDYQINGFANIPMSEIDTIIWSPTAGLSCLDCLNPFVDTLLNEIEYRVTIINQNGCEATDRIMLRVDKTREVFIPNAFSPHNNDGQNDKFMIFANNDKIKQINSFQVYDRWGEQVYLAVGFQPNDPAYGWDGTLDKEKLNPAVFVYWAEIEFIDGVVILYKGNVTLMQ